MSTFYNEEACSAFDVIVGYSYSSKLCCANVFKFSGKTFNFSKCSTILCYYLKALYIKSATVHGHMHLGPWKR